MSVNEGGLLQGRWRKQKNKNIRHQTLASYNEIKKRMERYGEEQIRMALVVSGFERPPKMLGSYELNDGKAAMIKETVVKEAESWGIGKEDG